jgi:glycosyltransferase involved in cell wall biosynthesis
MGKKIGLWYAHGSTSFSLKIALLLSHNVFTSTKSGFRLESKKVNIVGQGIDTDLFNLKDEKNNEKFEIISIGRISPVKDYETLIESIEILSEENINVSIIGDAGLGDQEKYFSGLKKMLKEKDLEDKIHFIEGMPNSDIVKYLQKSDLFVNTSHTGSLDKAILEAMSVGTPVLSCNEALLGVLGEHEEDLMFPKKNPEILAEKIRFIMNLENRRELGKSLRNIVVENHSLNNFVKKIGNNL